MTMAAALVSTLTTLTAAAGATAAATTTATAALAVGTMFAATVSVGGMTLAMALGGVDAMRTVGTALAALTAAGTTATAATTATTGAVGALAALGGRLDAGGAGGGRFAFGGRHGAEKTFHPTEEAGLLGGLTGVDRCAGCGRRVGGAGRAIAIPRLLLGTVVARLLLRTVVALATTTATTLAATLSAAAVVTGGTATGIGCALQHGNVAATHGTEHRTLFAEGRRGTGRCRCLRSLGGGSGSVALVREGGRFPALGRVFHFRRRKDVELGLGGGSGGFDDGRDGRDRSGGGSLRGLSNNRGCGGRGRSSERVLVFGLRLENLNGGGLVGAGGGGVADGGRSGRGADAFAAREARAAIGAVSGTPIGGGRCGRTGGRGRGLRGRAAGRGWI